MLNSLCDYKKNSAPLDGARKNIILIKPDASKIYLHEEFCTEFNSKNILLQTMN